VARRLAETARTMENVVLYIRAKPQGKHHRCGKDTPYIACDTPQSVRFWAPDPDCVERTLDFAVMSELLEPRMVVRFVTIDLPGIGRHTMPMVGEGYGVNLSPLTARGFDLESFGQDALGIVHTVGSAILAAYGLKPVADELGQVEEEEGLVHPKKSPAPQTAPKGEPQNGKEGQPRQQRREQQERRARPDRETERREGRAVRRHAGEVERGPDRFGARRGGGGNGGAGVGDR
jgi:hypothetical protein